VSKTKRRRKPRLQFLDSKGKESAVSIDIITARYLCELGFAAIKSNRPRDYKLRPDLTFDRVRRWLEARHRPVPGVTLGPDSTLRVAANAPHIQPDDGLDVRVSNLAALLDARPEPGD
jgi:hypothetical protein